MSKRRGIELNFEAIFQLAEKKNEVGDLENSLLQLYLLNRNHYDTRRLLNSRWIPTSVKLSILEKIFGPKTPQLFYNILYLLLEHNMAQKIYYAYMGFSNMVSQKTNRIIIQMNTAVSIPKERLSIFQEQLEKTMHKKITLINAVDANLVGGMYLKLPNGQIYDFSYKKALLNLKYYLSKKR